MTDELVVLQIRHQLNEHFPTKHYIRPDSNDMITDEKSGWPGNWQRYSEV